VVELPQTRAVAILTRAPDREGKTRLFSALGLAPDAALRAALLLDTIDACRGVAARLVIAVEPPDAWGAVQRLVADDVALMPQPDGDLGARMHGVIDTLLEDGASAVAVIGSDLPELTAEHLSQAFTLLDRDPDAIALGPADDGGYYLIAMCRPAPVFEGIDWGTDRVLAQTRLAAARCQRPTVLVGTLGDVDTPADLRRVCANAPRSRTAAWARAASLGDPPDR
jgi:rSAM/selenodomain-associated transferase 1